MSKFKAGGMIPPAPFTWCAECEMLSKYGTCSECRTYQMIEKKEAMAAAIMGDDDTPKPPFTYTVMCGETDPFRKKDSSIIQVDVSDDGELVCMRCRLSNCEHIKAVLELNLDVDIFYMEDVTVPMDLTHGVFVKFQLVGPPVAGSKGIYLHPDEGKIAAKAGLLGLISNGEPRKVLRSILLDWLKYYLMVEKLNNVCTASTHGYHEQRTLEQNLDSEGIMPYLETWCNLRNDCCMSCMEFITGDDDLVPSAPKKKGGIIPPRPGAKTPPKRPGRRP